MANVLAVNESQFNFPLRVRWSECDMQGVVFNAHYLTYVDICMTEYLRFRGIDYPAGLRAMGVDFFLVRSELDFRDSARFDDELELVLHEVTVGNSSFAPTIEVMRDGRVLVEAKLVYAIADPAGSGSLPVPGELRELLQTTTEQNPTA